MGMNVHQTFRSEIVDRIKAAGGRWKLPGGELVLPEVFGFCRGVTGAIALLDRALNKESAAGTRFFLLGQIIHNPWVNEYFRGRGVVMLDGPSIADLDSHLSPGDCGVIPAFGVTLDIETRLKAIGCKILDTTCGDVRRLWAWARHAVQEGFGVLIFGRAMHDETVVTKSRLEAVGGRYLVVGDLEEAKRFCDLVAGGDDSVSPRERFGRHASNADSMAPLLRLAQVSQTTMLYDETMEVRRLVNEAFKARFEKGCTARLAFQPTVCKATQQRQSAALELCRSKCDLIIVVGGFGSSNTTHLHELARQRGPAWFIEDAGGIVSADLIRAYDPETKQACGFSGWLPDRRPLTVGVLAGASSPENVIGEVLHRLADLLSK